jgi:SAM-dependent methyltransferase
MQDEVRAKKSRRPGRTTGAAPETKARGAASRIAKAAGAASGGGPKAKAKREKLRGYKVKSSGGPAVTAPEGVACNFCGSNAFVDHKGRGPYRCNTCGSVERNRVLGLYLNRFADLRPGMNVLHFAPERQVYPLIAEAAGPNYEICDIEPERYAKLSAKGVTVRRFDLCADVETLPDDHYDLILHNHVMEHLPCNVTAVLWHLHRALKPDGLHMFSLPIANGHYEEAIGAMEDAARIKQFGHPQHMRTFGIKDLRATLGMIFDIEPIIARPLVDLFGEETLRAANISESRWRSFNGSTLFLLRKDDLKLRRT